MTLAVLRDDRIASMKNRRGGTLIELLVALLLLDLALLSLASVGAVTAKRIGDAGRRSRATTAAANRLERLSALPCAAMTGGNAQLEPRVFETWTAARVGSFVDLTDSIEIAVRTPEHVVVRRRAPCL
jgi:Tfp pilus assembly protein PilV